MKVKVNALDKVIVNFDGEEMKDEKGRPLTVKRSISSALCVSENEPGEEKFKKFNLANKVHNAKADVEMTAEDASLIKATLAKYYGPLVIGAAYNALENG